MKVLYDWLKDYVGESMPSPEKVEDLLTFHAFEIDGVEEVEGKTVIDVKVLPDRAADCLSHRGIARELATLIGTPLASDPFTKKVELSPSTDAIKIHIENPDHCTRFAAALIEGVKIGPSPDWLSERLVALGQRSINNVVDATNYVMLSLGQPLHAYDADKCKSEFWIRMAYSGEFITTLSGETYPLDPRTQLVTMGHPTKGEIIGMPVQLGLAGIKGGKIAEVKDTTKNIILEAANFNPQTTRKGSQAVRIQTDASKRFENGISPEVVPYALTECAKLITEIAGGSILGYADAYPSRHENPTVVVTKDRVNALLGMNLTESEVQGIFNRLGFTWSGEGDSWSVVAPFERRDIMIPEDVIAEIGRVYGYEHVQSVIPEKAPLTEVNARHYYSEKVRECLVSEGFSEVVTSSFRKKDEVELQNALASDKGCLRSSLRENLGEVLDRNMPNLDLLGSGDVRVFEIGTVFNKKDGDVDEHLSLALGIRVKQQGHTPKDDTALEEVIQKLREVLGADMSFKMEKGVAEVNVTELLRELPVPVAYDVFEAKDVMFTPYSIYPFISRDIALWVPETVSAISIEEIIRSEAGELLVRTALFDEFKKEGRVSYAFRLVFQSFERTLTDEEVGEIMGHLTRLAEAKGFEVR